jgi:hypothetical protein
MVVGKCKKRWLTWQAFGETKESMPTQPLGHQSLGKEKKTQKI